MKMWIIALFAVLLVAASAEAGDCYKWVDQAGRIHYGDQPPENEECEEITVVEPPSEEERQRAESRQEVIRGEVDAFLRQRAERRQAAAVEHRIKQERCEAYQRELNWLRQSWGLYMARPDAEGNLHWITEAERLYRMEYLRQEIERRCK